MIVWLLKLFFHAVFWSLSTGQSHQAVSSLSLGGGIKAAEIDPAPVN